MRRGALLASTCLRLTLCMLLLAGCYSPNKKETTSTEEEDIPPPPSEQAKAKSHGYTVEIKQMKFEPAEITVHKGDEVTWINRDIVDHDVTEQTGKDATGSPIGKGWHSSRLASGASWTMTANKSADYYCNLHQAMKGKLIVVE